MGGPVWRLAVVLGVGVAALVAPLLAPSDYVVGVLTRICLYATLALGLNIVVGFAGLLDLGYVAFFGIGSYLYAFLASPHFGIHLPFLLALPDRTERQTLRHLFALNRRLAKAYLLKEQLAEDAHEGARAFVEKRPPRYRGR